MHKMDFNDSNNSIAQSPNGTSCFISYSACHALPLINNNHTKMINRATFENTSIPQASSSLIEKKVINVHFLFELACILCAIQPNYALL